MKTCMLAAVGVAFTCGGAVFADLSAEAKEVASETVVQGADLIDIDFVNGGTKLGKTHHYTVGARIAAVPESPTQDCATFLGWYSGETAVTPETPVAAGMREIIAK